MMRVQVECAKAWLLFILAIVWALPAFGQAPEPSQLDPKTKKIMADAASKGFPLSTNVIISGSPQASRAKAAAAPNQQTPATKETKPGGGTPKANPDAKAQPTDAGTVEDNITVEAVLLPYSVSQHVFGKEVATNYIAIELTISNHSQIASLIVESVYVDYSQWALSGWAILQNSSVSGNTPGGKNKKSTNSAHAEPTQIASAEYRSVRGDLMDTQPWTKRNITMRALEAAGAIATAYAFSISEKGIIRGIAAFNGQVIPAAKAFWPDGTQEQLNRISDLGFKVNKVIAKNSSDIVVGFFPIDTLLTPGFKKLFLKSPSLLYTPYAVLFDHDYQKDLRPFIKTMLGNSSDAEVDGFLHQLPCIYMNMYKESIEPKAEAESKSATGTPPASTETAPWECKEKRGGQELAVWFLAHASLETVHVDVKGDMAINLNQVPAKIDSLEMKGGNAVWSNTKTPVEGTLRGSFFTGATAINIAEVEALQIKDIKLVATGSSDSALNFTMQLTEPITKGKTLTFTVVKTDKDGNSVVSNSLTFPVPDLSAKAPIQTGATVDKNRKLTISGQDFPTDDTLKILLFEPGKDSSKEASAKFTVGKTDFATANSGTVDIDLSKLKDFPPLSDSKTESAC